MNGRPLVSIVTPSLNRAGLLEQTIRSVMGQSYPRLEHIIVDGGSTDGTLDLLRQCEGSDKVRWISERDGGMYEAINKGLRLANGEILAYLNSDDLYFPWAVEVVVDAFRRYPLADVVFGDAIRLDELRGGLVPLFAPAFDPRMTAAGGSLVQPAVFFHRRLLDDIGPFDESFRYVADLDYWLRASRGHRLQQVEEFLAVDRVHEGALSQARRLEMADEDRRMRRGHAASLNLPPGTAMWSRLRSGLWRRWQWVRFVRSTRNRRSSAGSWRRLIEAAHPRVSAGDAILALAPRTGWHHMADVRWGTAPIAVVLGGVVPLG